MAKKSKSELDLVVCNCACCGSILLSKTMEGLDWVDRVCDNVYGRKLPFIAGRIRERPYCSRCLDAPILPGRYSSTSVSTAQYDPESDSPWHENAVRCMEG